MNVEVVWKKSYEGWSEEKSAKAKKKEKIFDENFR